MFSLMRHLGPKAGVGLLVALLAVSACAHRHRGRAQYAGDVHYPAWVLAGSRLATDGGVRALVAVGQIDGMRNVALARATADNRARAQLARLLETYLGAVLASLPPLAAEPTATPPSGKNHAELPAPAKGSEALSHPNEAALAKWVLAAALPSVQISDRWFHPDRGAVFCQARLELEELREAIARLRELREDVQEALLAALVPTHERLAAAQAP